MSRTIGNFWNKKAKKMDVTLQSSLGNHGYKKKDFHYKMPTFSTGILKQKERNYKHT